MTLTEGLDSLAEIAQQVPSIRYLDSVRSTLANAVAIGSGTIAGANLDAGTVAKPRGTSCGLTVREQIDDFVLLKVDQHGAVVAAAPPCPYVDGGALKKPWYNDSIVREIGRLGRKERDQLELFITG